MKNLLKSFKIMHSESESTTEKCKLFETEMKGSSKLICKIVFAILFLLLIIALLVFGFYKSSYIATYFIVPNMNSPILVHVIFSNGDQTLKHQNTYPTDPHREFIENQKKHKENALTDYGKVKEFLIGTALRERYYNLIGHPNSRNFVVSTSLNESKCIESLDIVLAGLFPLKGPRNTTYQFHYNLEDEVLFNFKNSSFQDEYQSFQLKNESQQKLESFQSIFDYLTIKTGRDIKNFDDCFRLYRTFAIQESLGMELPAWTNQIYPQVLKKLAIKALYLRTATKTLRQYTSGPIIKKILDDSTKKIEGDESLNHVKMFLYSAQPAHIAYILIGLGIFEPHIPPFGSYLTIEVYRRYSQHIIKIFYQNYETGYPQEIMLKQCAPFCSLNDFQDFVKLYLMSENGYDLMYE